MLSAAQLLTRRPPGTCMCLAACLTRRARDGMLVARCLCVWLGQVVPALDPNTPIYAGGFSMQLIKRRMMEFNLWNPDRFKVFHMRERFQLGPFECAPRKVPRQHIYVGSAWRAVHAAERGICSSMNLVLVTLLWNANIEHCVSDGMKAVAT